MNLWYISGYHCKLPGSYQLPTRHTAGSHYSLVPRPCWRRKWPENKVTSHDLPVKVDELVVHFRRLPDHFTILLFLFSHLGLSLAAAPLHFMHKSCWHGWGRSPRRIIWQWYVPKQIYTLLHNIYMYVYTWYSTTIDSCHLDEFFMEMDVHEELLNGTHILYLYHKRFLRLQTYQ